MDPELVRWLSSLGVGGAIAGFMFMFYRSDRLTSEKSTLNYAKQLEIHAQIWHEDRKLLMEVLKSTSESMQRLSTSIDANTAAVTWLIRNPENHH